MRLLALLPLVIACADEPAPEVLGGEYGFEVRTAVAIECPPDFQGQFWKVFVEGVAPASGCDMDFPRAVPVTCEDRQAYLDAMGPVCLGANAAPGEYLPMLDYLVQEEGGAFSDFGWVPMTVCQDGEEHLVELWGETRITAGDLSMRLDLDLYDEDGEESLLSGTVDALVCP